MSKKQYKTMTLNYNTMEEIDHFITKSIHHFRMLNVSNRELKILVPEYFLKALQMYNQTTTLGFNVSNKYNGVEFGQHYKQEIVVFYPLFFYNPEYFEAQIFEIPFE